MKISAIPYSNMDTATTRLRFYAVLNALPSEYTWSKCNKLAEGDILYIQKKADRDTLRTAMAAKDKGIKIVYDLGDPAIYDEEHHRITMLRLANVITTDTENRKTELLQYVKNIVVVPDCIDYEGTYRTFEYAPEIKRIVTFGNTESITAAAPYMNPLPLKKVYITNNKRPCFPDAKFVEWKYDSFIKNLAKNDLCLLVQSNHSKSNNRLLVCMRLGIPFVVADSPSYRETVKATGLKHLIVKDSIDIEAVIISCMSESLDMRFMTSMIAVKHVMNYTASKSALKLAEAFKMAVANA